VPTFERTPRFAEDWLRLSPSQRAAFHEARRQLVADLVAGRRPRKGLRVKRFQGIAGGFELTWSADGRALWKYGSEVPGKPAPHVVWLRIGTHDIYKSR
jgi:hypothetical protein